MRVIKKIVLDMNRPLPGGRFVELYREEENVQVPYFQELKKGRESLSQVTDQSLANSKADTAKQGEQYNAEKGDLGQLDTIGANGLGLGASGYLANQLASIGQTYGNARTNAARVAAQRGFNAPEGAFASGLNSANIAQARDENSAYGNAQMLTRENELAAMGARQGLQAQYDPNHALNTASDSAYKQSQAGSLLGDIGKGISTGAALVTPAFGCWIAEATWGKDDVRTHIVRGWLNYSWSARSKIGRIVMTLYRLFGERVARWPKVVRALRPLFDSALNHALTESW